MAGIENKAAAPADFLINSLLVSFFFSFIIIVLNGFSYDINDPEI
jgi:hypothetical protein